MLNWDSFVSLKGTVANTKPGYMIIAWLQTACGSKSQHNVSAYLKCLRFFPTATTDSSCRFIAKTKQQQKKCFVWKTVSKTASLKRSCWAEESQQKHDNCTYKAIWCCQRGSRNVWSVHHCGSDWKFSTTTDIRCPQSKKPPLITQLFSWCYFKVCRFYWHALIFARWRLVVHTEWTLVTYEVGHIKGFCSAITNMDMTSMYLGIDTSGWTVMFVT